MFQWLKEKKVPMIILLVIIIVTGVVIYTIDTLNNESKPTYEEVYIDNDNWGDTDRNENISTTQSSYDPWDSSTPYNKGDKVIFNGKIYEAKWWNEGTSPNESNEWGAWTLIGDDNSDKIEANTEDNNEDASSPSESLSGSDFKVVGYFPEWKPQKEKEIQYKKLTHINYSFAIPNSDGTIKALADPDLAKKVIKNAHSAGTKVFIAVGGWEYNGTPLEATFVAATDSDEKCKKLANSILSLVDEYGFDGVDMDWEHPRTDGDSKNQYANLLKYLREGLTKRDKLLSSAVLAGVNAEGNILWDSAGHTDEALASVDWVNVMAYDGGDGDRHSSLDFAINSANYWRKTRNLPASKVVLGVPFYGRPSWASYEDILKADGDAYKKDIATIDGKEAHYNGIETIKKKTKWALENTSGIMIWEISQDTTEKDKSLLNAIYETVK